MYVLVMIPILMITDEGRKEIEETVVMVKKNIEGFNKRIQTLITQYFPSIISENSVMSLGSLNIY